MHLSTDHREPSRSVPFACGRPAQFDLTDPNTCAHVSTPGMIIFSQAARILHMNNQARMLMGLFGEVHGLWPNLATESLPSTVAELCSEILSELHCRTQTEDWVQIEIRRICHMVTPSLLLKGFGMPGSSNGDSWMIVTLEPFDPLSLPQTRV
ncbi:hypothetical protein W02_22560 [Nitrospira sp. KM1]|uniref:hypothetical protein n=1 Tax=Nitrospira sp. KM1 TaxID=1936990 RepID=UPI0013A7A6D4|nr:hypothetical protein [Nitrospira sp. KM1]BCA55116.1 hypothetical protein W02_22560 [Nitrospira sp. KM1]